ncbi:MAG TPA: hypothetical protein VKU00_19845, partial [Chthonomonadaceae bacterium]|nr:hypothetical protein [Chthonomonadaceae bacterium]
YNRRAKDPRFERLTFCLLGVAAPTDLIRDTRMTPFNIGRRIELTDFTLDEAAPLEPNPPAGGLGRILYWTGGHPYLTQRLCQAIAEDALAQQKPTIENQDVDRLCEDLFLSPQARERDDNLIFVRERLLRSEEDRASLLDLYSRVRAGQRIKSDETNPLIALLRLSGIVRSQEGMLHVRNRIYERVFDRAWIRENMPDAEVRRQKQAFRRGVVRTLTVSAVVLALLVGGFLLSHYKPHLNIRKTFPDGSTLVLDDITYGKKHQYEAGTGRWLGILPGSSTLVTDTDVMVAWITRQQKQSHRTMQVKQPPSMLMFGSLKVSAVDEHGCCFEGAYQFTGNDNITSISDGYMFSSFPRRSKSVTLRINDFTGNPLTELVVPNPAPTLYPLWTPEPLPDTKQAGDLAITLTALRCGKNGFGSGPNNYALVPEFRFALHGKLTEEWEISDWNNASVEDVTGNISKTDTCELCPYEPAWKFTTSFFRKNTAAFAPAETWTIKDVPMPGPGQLNTISRQTTQNGVTLEVKSIAGAGIYSYVNKENGTFLAKWDPIKNGAGGFSVAGSGNGMQNLNTVSASVPYLTLVVQNLKPNQHLTVWATDARGRRFNMLYSNLDFIGLDIPSGITSVDLHFVVQTARTASFLIKPPLPPVKTAK